MTVQIPELEFRLSRFFSEHSVVRDATVHCTMLPNTSIPGSVCYALNNAQLRRISKNPNIAAVITTQELGKLVEVGQGCVISEDPAADYYRLHNHLVNSEGMCVLNGQNINSSATIAKSAIISKNVEIGPGVIVEDFAVIADGSVIGEGSYIGQGVVIGARGMQNLRVNGNKFNVEYAGGVRIGKNCEVLAGAIIQKPYHPFFTEIENSVQVSVRVVVGHGSIIGQGSSIAGSSQIAGNVKIGANVWIGPSCTISDGLTIGNSARILVGSVVNRNLASEEKVSGNFAVCHTANLRRQLSVQHES